MGFVTLDSTVSSASIDISLDGIIPNNHDFSNFGKINIWWEMSPGG